MTTHAWSNVAPYHLHADHASQFQSGPLLIALEPTTDAYRDCPQRSSAHRRRISRSCMDFNRRSRPDTGMPRDRRYQSGGLPLRQREGSSTVVDQAPRSSPLPQTQWSDLPTAYRPRDWPGEPSQSSSMVPDPLQPQRPQTVDPATGRADPKLQVPRQRRRPQPLDDDTLARPFDPSLLYPQLSPYDPPASAASAPEQLQHFPRAVSQPNTPFYHQTTFQDPELDIRPVPRSPTYPPASRRRRGEHATNASDAAFEDEEEFRLFVEATAGLGPIPTLGHSGSSPSSSSEHLASRDRSTAPPRPTIRTLSSPVSETPTTVQALAHIAQMPESRSISEAHRERLRASAEGLDLRLPTSPVSERHPSRVHSAGPAASPTWIDVPDVSPVEEELPDYASSQAQAQAAQRAEAARRAAELQRRWKASRDNW